MSTAHGISHVYILIIPPVQDTVVIVPTHPFTLQDEWGRPVEVSWYACPRPCFTGLMQPTDGRPPSRTNYTHGTDDILLELVFFSTLSRWIYPKTAQWRKLECKNLMPVSLPQYPS